MKKRREEKTSEERVHETRERERERDATQTGSFWLFLIAVAVCCLLFAVEFVEFWDIGSRY